MDSKENAVLKAVEAFSDDIVEFTGRLVAEPSTLQNEASVNKVMEDALVGLGYDPVRVPIDPDRLSKHPGFASVPWEYDPASGRHNLVAVLKGTDSNANSALFNGHLDVAPETPLECWTMDPFAPVVKDGWMYGRGAGDMKAGVAAMVYAAKAVERAGFALKGDLTLQTVIEEECSGNGALACLDAGYDADAVLIPEPFNLTILTQQVGVLWFRVDVSGVASHVLDTQAGFNAVEKLYPIIQALRTLEKEMNAAPHPAGFEHLDNPLNLNIGILKGGFWPSTVPSSAELHCRLGFYPHESYESACARIVECVRKAAAADPWLAANQPKVSFYGFRSRGHSVDRQHPVLQIVRDGHSQLTGTEPADYNCTCTTDLRAFFCYGKARGTCYGPVAENIHAADERVRIDSIIQTAKVYGLFLARWCGLAE